MRSIFTFILLFAGIGQAVAQKETFDLVTYQPVKGWNKERTDKYVSFSTADEAKGTFCVISIYPSIAGGDNGKSNFDHAWQSIVQEPLHGGTPKMEEPAMENGWELQTGSSSFRKEGVEGTAMLITATGGGRMVNMLVLVNSDHYTARLQAFIGSMTLKKVPVMNENSTSPIPGIWQSNIFETTGYMNNMPQYSGGYFRKEYQFKTDGTYLFLQKDWSAYGTSIYFTYETGTWSASGNTLTVTPASGKRESWSKSAAGRTEEWGKLLKTENRKLEKVTYTFTVKNYTGSQNTALELYFSKPTEREGSPGSNVQSQMKSFSGSTKSIIVLPPGWK